jgi:hypothetical protein
MDVIDLQRKAERLVNNEVLVCASLLNDHLYHVSSEYQRAYHNECLWREDEQHITFYETWIVTSWLAARLLEEDEAVIEFRGLWLWQRATTGQAIYMDHVIQSIATK